MTTYAQRSIHFVCAGNTENSRPFQCNTSISVSSFNLVIFLCTRIRCTIRVNHSCPWLLSLPVQSALRLPPLCVIKPIAFVQTVITIPCWAFWIFIMVSKCGTQCSVRTFPIIFPYIFSRYILLIVASWDQKTWYPCRQDIAVLVATRYTVRLTSPICYDTSFAGLDYLTDMPRLTYRDFVCPVVSTVEDTAEVSVFFSVISFLPIRPTLFCIGRTANLVKIRIIIMPHCSVFR